MLCVVLFEGRGHWECRRWVPRPGPHRREQHGSVWSVCACHQSQASLVPSVSPLHCHVVPPGMTSNTAAQEHCQSVTCGSHLLAPIVKCGDMFYLETFGEMKSRWKGFRNFKRELSFDKHDFQCTSHWSRQIVFNIWHFPDVRDSSQTGSTAESRVISSDVLLFLTKIPELSQATSKWSNQWYWC